MIEGERAGAGVRGSRSPKYEVGVANVVRLCARACDIVSEPDPRKIDFRGSGSETTCDSVKRAG